VTFGVGRCGVERLERRVTSSRTTPATRS
jgi:hypothetical protein